MMKVVTIESVLFWWTFIFSFPLLIQREGDTAKQGEGRSIPKIEL
jgi:hypothetical protein